MVYEELSARLNETGYKNWLKAGYCLLKLRDGLEGFIDEQMRRFHGRLINSNPALNREKRCQIRCRPKGNQKEIRRHHTNRAGIINWGNCKPWLWPCEHWEIAKAYMPRGQMDVTGASQCDAAALLNLINFCDHFSNVDQRQVRQVIQRRNELMHSCEMRVSAQWMEQYERELQSLLLALRQVPGVATAAQEIKEMLSVDWSVHVPGMDSTDGPGSEQHISEVETELLRELLLDFGGGEPHTEQSLEDLQRLRDFLKSHRDLEERFHAELKTIEGSINQAVHADGGSNVVTGVITSSTVKGMSVNIQSSTSSGLNNRQPTPSAVGAEPSSKSKSAIGSNIGAYNHSNVVAPVIQGSDVFGYSISVNQAPAAALPDPSQNVKEATPSAEG
ncbi:uncharacterized protein CXorf38 homolog isoform X2 [Amia ocellicauda]|uniref:uncharacterized protein CXorf38 homolog isoform X2 n=1 Tax=Amia ocellicauda TaxID=2972642 RepID=UPI003463ABBE